MPFLTLIEVSNENSLKTTTACFGAPSFWVITHTYIYVISDGNVDYSFNTKLKLKYSMERIVIKIKQETAKVIICIKELYLSSLQFEGSLS